jgi:hypothetical protein
MPPGSDANPGQRSRSARLCGHPGHGQHASAATQWSRSARLCGHPSRPPCGMRFRRWVPWRAQVSTLLVLPVIPPPPPRWGWRRRLPGPPPAVSRPALAAAGGHTAAAGAQSHEPVRRFGVLGGASRPDPGPAPSVGVAEAAPWTPPGGLPPRHWPPAPVRICSSS